MFGFSKWFVIFIFLSLIVGYGTKNWIVAGQIMIAFGVIMFFWRLFTR